MLSYAERLKRLYGPFDTDLGDIAERVGYGVQTCLTAAIIGREDLVQKALDIKPHDYDLNVKPVVEYIKTNMFDHWDEAASEMQNLLISTAVEVIPAEAAE